MDIDNLTTNTKLKIIELEKYQMLQNLALSIYHCCQILCSKTQIAKIIENDRAIKFVKTIK